MKCLAFSVIFSKGPESTRMPNGKIVPGATVARFMKQSHIVELRAGFSKKQKMVRG